MNIIKKWTSKRMQKAGLSPHFAYPMFEKIFDDFLKNKSTSFRQKLWALKRGFLSTKIDFYGLTEDNYKNYLSDFNYYGLHPINGTFSHWIDDKLTIKHLLSPFSENLPKYYYHIYNGELLRLPDCPEDIETSPAGVINLLKEKKSLALKPQAGSKGEGFIKLSYDEGTFAIDHHRTSENTIIESITEWIKNDEVGLLITEFLLPCRELSKIWGHSANTLRISVLRENNASPSLIYAYIRFGTEKTGSIDNANAGGVSCQIDLDSGEFSKGLILENNRLVKCKTHPDTGALMEGFIPYWEVIKTKIIQISKQIPQIVYMGFDIIVTDDGFKIIEINSHEGIVQNQRHSPYLQNEPTRRFFTQRIQDKKKQLDNKKVRNFPKRIIRFAKKLFSN